MIGQVDLRSIKKMMLIEVMYRIVPAGICLLWQPVRSRDQVEIRGKQSRARFRFTSVASLRCKCVLS